jgi:hypothetical protein
MHLLLVIRATNSNYLSESFLYLQHRQRRSSEVVNFYLVKKEPLQCVFIPIKLPLYICMLSKSIPLPSYCYYFPVLSVKESWLSTYGWLRPTKQKYRQFITIIVHTETQVWATQKHEPATQFWVATHQLRNTVLDQWQFYHSWWHLLLKTTKTTFVAIIRLMESIYVISKWSLLTDSPEFWKKSDISSEPSRIAEQRFAASIKKAIVEVQFCNI